MSQKHCSHKPSTASHFAPSESGQPIDPSFCELQAAPSISDPVGYRVVGPLDRISGDVPNIFDDDDAQGFYVSCRIGQVGERIRCFHLNRTADGADVGFVGFSRCIEDHGDTLVAWVSIDYMYLRPDCRGKNLSYVFADEIFRRITEWLDKLEAVLLEGQSLRVTSVNTALSKAGAAVAKNLDHRLQAYCVRRGWKMRSTLDMQLG